MGGISGIIAGLVGSGAGENTIDMSQLLQTIQGAGQYQQQIINALPAEIQQNLQKYIASQNAASTTLGSNITGLGNDTMSKISSLYGPNSAAGVAQKTANTQNIYSTVPGTQNAIRNALAATGGLSRGNAAVSLAQPYVAAASANSAANNAVDASQTAAGQQATQQAIMAIQSMDANTFQTQFGMSQAQATQILQTGNQALKDQLTQLINQSVTQTNQTLGVQGVAATNAFNNAQQQSANQNAVWSGLGNLAVGGGMAALGGPAGIFAGLGGGMSGLPAGADVTSPSYTANMNANSPLGY